MKQLKFGAFDIILAVLIVAGIGFNVFAYGFYNKDGSGGKPGDSGKPTTTAGSTSGVDSVAAQVGGALEQSGGTSAQGGNAPAQGATEQPPNTSAPTSASTPSPVQQTSVINTLVFWLNSPNISVNGQEAAIDEPGSAPYNHSGVSVLPLRAIYELLGGSIEFDPDTKYITARFLDTSLKVKTDETGAEVNGTFTALAVAPVTKDGTIYVPARVVADALGAELTWDGETQSITLAIPSQSAINTSLLLPAIPLNLSNPAGQLPAGTTPSGEPTAADFAWFTDGIYKTGVPQGAARITDMSLIMDDWKMFIWIDPDHVAYYDSSYILAAASIDEIGGAVFMVVQELKMVDEDGTTQDISRFDPESYTGVYLPPNYTGISVGESWHRYTITDFYTTGGKQYGIGVLEVQSGKPCYIALVRP